MDVKEPSVGASQRSRSQTNRSQVQYVAQTLDGVALRVTVEPEGQIAKAIVAPLIIGDLIQNLVNLFYVYIVWLYVGSVAVAYLSIAYSIQYFVSTAVPKAIAQAYVTYMSRQIANSQLKQVEEGFAYHFLISGIYWIVALFLAFFLSISFNAQAGIGANDTNYAGTYLPLKMVIGTLLSIFNEATEAILLFESKNAANLLRKVSTSLLGLLFVLMAYQYSKAQGVTISLTYLGAGQVIGYLVPSVVIFFYYQGFTEIGTHGVLRMKLYLLKPFNADIIRRLSLAILPKVSYFGSQALICFCCNMVVTQVYTDPLDIWIARVGLLIYYMGYNMFGSVMISCMSGAEYQLSLNLMTKKYIRSKAFMLKQFIWALVIQVILLVLGFVGGKVFLELFIPTSQKYTMDYFILYGSSYMTYSVYMPIAMVPFYYCEAVLAIEGNWKMNTVLNIIHPVLAIITLLVLQFTVGDRADMFWPEFYADLFAGVCGLLLLFRKIFEVMQLSKIELRRLKKKKRYEEEESITKKD